MALSDEQIDAVTLLQWGEMKGQPLAAHRAYARAVEAEVRGQDEALIRQMLGALDDGSDHTEQCVMQYWPDRPCDCGKAAALAAARLRLEGKP